MENFVIIVIIIAFTAIGTIYTVKHFKGKGGCCGGGSYKPKRKKLGNVKYTKSFSISGIHCKHCKQRVEELVNDIKGISGKADLKHSRLTVYYAEDVPDEIIKIKLEKAGYSLGEKT